MAKRVRQKFVKSEQLRGKHFKKGALDTIRRQALTGIKSAEASRT